MGPIRMTLVGPEVQRKVNRMVMGFEFMTWEEQLKEMGIFHLEKKRLQDAWGEAGR